MGIDMTPLAFPKMKHLRYFGLFFAGILAVACSEPVNTETDPRQTFRDSIRYSDSLAAQALADSLIQVHPELGQKADTSVELMEGSPGSMD